MKKLLLFIFTSFNFAGLTAQEIKEGARIEILDSIALEVINPDAAITVIAKGFQWTEGPLYVAAGDYLLFSDIHQFHRAPQLRPPRSLVRRLRHDERKGRSSMVYH